MKGKNSRIGNECTSEYQACADACNNDTRAPQGRKRAGFARVAQPEASECEAVGLGLGQKIDEPRRGDTRVNSEIHHSR
jgi:hypothetical protein